MGKKNHKKAIRSLNRRIAEHQEKIRLEYERDSPDEGFIKHWELRFVPLKKVFNKHSNDWGNKLCRFAIALFLLSIPL